MMAEDDGAGQEGALEQLLEMQLVDQKSTLVALDEALDADPSNDELLAVREELILSIRDAEDGLLHLKRSRLLREVDKIASIKGSDSSIKDTENVKRQDPAKNAVANQEHGSFAVGSKCRFRYSDGRWYNGSLVRLEGHDSARISFLNPTSEKMLLCKFFLQERCRFGNSCRMSHGFHVPISFLKPYRPILWEESLVGSHIWAAPGGSLSAIWREAELESWDDKLKLAGVVFRDGTSEKLAVDSLSLSAYAQLTDDEDQDEEEEDDEDDDEQKELSCGSSSSSELDEDDSISVHRGLGLLKASSSEGGVQTETAIFAKWEHHTRGIASKMMVSMGYREGMGLGVSGQGMVNPIPVKVLLSRQSLDHAVRSTPEEPTGSIRSKKRTRGGQREREKKQAAIARANPEDNHRQSDVFSFINEQLAGSGSSNGSSHGNKGRDRVEEGEDRRSLVAHGEKVKDLRTRVQRLEEMVTRNRRDKGVFEAASRKLDETRKALHQAEAAHASASHAIVSKEKEKRWLKF
ncbi:zinc finger (CCCH-type) family protein / D111/G-patch domain-containing protein [Wolffia australiana]